ncbi:MAG: hypothetical protein IKY12_01485, partial [Clostridia bacterium]|nr:hypothetical protein [Clostridia bacterium]
MNSRNLPDNSKIRISSEGDTRHINEYYISVSRYYKLAKFITLLILVLFVLLMVSVFRDDITSENFRYMLKNLDMQTDSVVESYSTVEFESPSETEVSLFGSNLAVCTKNKLTLFNLSGRKVLSEDVNLTNPIINTDGRYIMAYEMGQNSISLFNSFAKVYEETLDFPISDVASSNNGYFLVVTKTREYTSCVVLYDSEFDVINRVFKDKHVMCVD